jgi:hypothetical protein
MKNKESAMSDICGKCDKEIAHRKSKKENGKVVHVTCPVYVVDEWGRLVPEACITPAALMPDADEVNGSKEAYMRALKKIRAQAREANVGYSHGVYKGKRYLRFKAAAEPAILEVHKVAMEVFGEDVTEIYNRKNKAGEETGVGFTIRPPMEVYG